ncbi:hypothetical protein jhhlp_007036 [Lomentospora prolificans]|uniref:Glycogen debranching enzyme n=1 Tax=Lomentospora prolificans TaxID=41688 RepID=A0A2N3N1H7_9PEZI|nr:hypothetical protein jhhlp_007036 [Lomentospora prolificans]
MGPRTVTSNEVYVLHLNDDGSPAVPRQYVYIEPKTSEGLVIRFSIEGTSPICRHGSLWVNIPEKDKPFEREKFREFKLNPDFNRTIEVSVPVHQTGAYTYYITYAELPSISESVESNDASPGQKVKKSDLYYIVFAPELTLDGRRLPLDALSIFTVLSKSMGKYPDDWEPHLRSISERGYNMVHFPPLQTRGDSDSPYSLKDQLGWDKSAFPNGEKDAVSMIESLEKDYGMLALTDIVLNHTSPNTAWLREHPEAGYNLNTAPWLLSANELDLKIKELSGSMKDLGVPYDIKSEDDLLKVMDAIKNEGVAAIKLWEYYAMDVDRDAEAAVSSWLRGEYSFPSDEELRGDINNLKSLTLKDQADLLAKHALRGTEHLGERFHRSIDPKYGAGILVGLLGKYQEEHGPTKTAAKERLLPILDEVNMKFYREYDRDVSDMLHHLYNRLKWDRLESHGPRLGPITAESPISESYFTRLPENEDTKSKGFTERDLTLVNNGWLWDANALIDNAGPESRAYLKREVFSWGDCVKLRYGKSHDDNPWLWDHMASYARMLAKYFHGFRIDNCHSTGITIAEYMLDQARSVRPNLYVIAELFTGSEDTDYIFVRRLGLDCLIREAMQCWDTGELSRLVHRYAGRPIGSFEPDDAVTAVNKPHPDGLNGEKSAATSENADRSTKEVVRVVKETTVAALFNDCTHDNEVPAQKRDARDTLPNAALVGMCACATGSVMGYDEIYPRRIDLVGEKRLYKPVKIGKDDGIGRVKKIINQIHTVMGKDGYHEAHIHHEDQYITVHRVHPDSRKGYFLIAHTAFPGYGNGNGAVSPVHLPGTRARHLGSWMLEVDSSEEAVQKCQKDKTYLSGLPSRVIDVPGIRMEVKGDDTIITVRDKFPPGSIALFETWIPAAEHAAGLDSFVTNGAKEAFSELDLVDLNFVLYRSEAEERDASGGVNGVYEIPRHGKLVYAGLQGWWSVLKNVIRNNDLAHPLCENLRNGLWSMDYIVGRLEKMSEQLGHERLIQPAKWLRERFDAVRPIPSFLIPRYFGLIIKTAYDAACDRALSLMSPTIQQSQWFIHSLALVSVQQTGWTKSASLYPDKLAPSLAAGLPHFATDWARCWGRDVFISLRGLFLGTGRFDEARDHIFAFASVLKHGLIPNLLGSGKNPRYNARDAVWFFLQSIQDYTKMAPSGLDLLQDKVKRRFLPYDDTWFPYDDDRAYSKESTIEDIIQEALQRHAEGISFREHNAGPDLDRQMSDKGFDVEVRVDWDNGIVFGGSQYNCGTWMDKMGESERAKSKGVPGTPRDGAAVEITGLLYSTLSWVAGLHAGGKYKYSGVKKADGSEISFSDWADLIKANFERCYFVPRSAEEDKDFDVDPNVVNRRGIYKDLYRSGKPFEDYQLRPNFPIAMTVAPELFTPSRALHALSLADGVLRGPTGMATLDPRDLNYRPYYNNGEDSEDFATSKGRNYHQGPEWLWPTGFFLRALLKFDLQRREDNEGRIEAFQQVTRRLEGCKKMIKETEWAGLAELTQKDGAVCNDSCPTQAWSAGCLIDLYIDAAELQEKLVKREPIIP